MPDSGKPGDGNRGRAGSGETEVGRAGDWTLGAGDRPAVTRWSDGWSGRGIIRGTIYAQSQDQCKHAVGCQMQARPAYITSHQ